MSGESQQYSGIPKGFWEHLTGWFIDNKLVVLIIICMIIGAGVYVSPFDWDVGEFPRDPVPVDAIPDIGENQQIVFTEWRGRSPRDIEDQVTYPLTTALLGISGIRTVRSYSMFGFSSIYVIFDDDVEFYWSRSRILEKLAALPEGTLPDEAKPTLGPDATALGQIFWYTLEGRDEKGNLVGGWDQDELRSVQDWTVRYALQSADGVAEVASIGGFVREYQVDVDPEAMRAHGIELAQVAAAVRESNLDAGARTLEINNVEYLVRGVGFVKSIADLESAVVAVRDHTPIRVRDVAHVTLGPELRTGALDDAGAAAVGGIVVARFLENPLQVINAVKAKIAQIQKGLPKRTLSDGTVSQVTIVPFYDRTELIHETLDTLSVALYEEILITVIVVLVLLGNLRSSFMISSILPLGVLLAFVLMKTAGVSANVMALGGIAIAIGTMVDMGIVFVENMNQHLERAPDDADRAIVLRRAAAEVAPAVLTSVATTVVSFLPVFGLTASEARLFGPLAITKTFAMTGAYFLAVTVLPGLGYVVLRRRPQAVAGVSSVPLRILKSLFRFSHMRDWLLLGLGAGLARYNTVAGLLILFLALFRLARPLIGDKMVKILSWVENLLAVAGVTVALADHWLPLGPGPGFGLNLLFVGVVIASLMGTFKLFEASYPFLLRTFLRHKLAFLSLPLLLAVSGITIWLGFGRVFGWLPENAKAHPLYERASETFPGLGREYMPPFDEGSFLYMPSTMPHASLGAALGLISELDAALAKIPEVDRVVGKLGRAETSLDPAPISMVETLITYVPEYRTDPDGKRVRQWRDSIRTADDIWDEIVKAANIPGLTSAPQLMPINTRIVMLQSGMRAPMGVKVHGPDLDTIEKFGLDLEALLKGVPEIRPETVFADRVVGKPYLEIDIDREAIGRFGLSIVAVQEALGVALGGMTLTRTVEGRERYAVRVRYMREERDTVEAIGRIFVPAPNGEQIPLSQLAEVRYVRGPEMIKSEDTFLTSYVLFDKKAEIAEVDAVEHARAAIDAKIASGELHVPAGVSFSFAGTYENQVQSEKRLMVLIPVALALIFILLYLQFHRVVISAIIYSGVVVAASGGFLIIWLYGQGWFLDAEVFGAPLRDLFGVGTVHLSVAVWVGFIALLGVATDDGVVICTYLRQRFDEAPPRTVEEVRERTLEAGTRRVRPCLMTTATTILALMPVLTSQGRGSDVMIPMALPSVGGMSIELITLFVVPVLFSAVEELRLKLSKKNA